MRGALGKGGVGKIVGRGYPTMFAPVGVPSLHSVDRCISHETLVSVAVRRTLSSSHLERVAFVLGTRLGWWGSGGWWSPYEKEAAVRYRAERKKLLLASLAVLRATA